MPAESKEFRIKIKTPDFKAYGNKVINDLQIFVPQIDGWSIVPNNHEGIRVSCNSESGNGWFLLRLSLHDPVMALNAESNQPCGTSMITADLHSFLKGYSDLEIDLMK